MSQVWRMLVRTVTDCRPLIAVSLTPSIGDRGALHHDETPWSADAEDDPASAPRCGGVPRVLRASVPNAKVSCVLFLCFCVPRIFF